MVKKSKTITFTMVIDEFITDKDIENYLKRNIPFINNIVNIIDTHIYYDNNVEIRENMNVIDSLKYILTVLNERLEVLYKK